MRLWTVYSLVFFFAAGPCVCAQMPQPSVPDNALNSTNTIGLPASASREGTSEVVDLTSGALNFFLPAVTLAQRAGAAPLELGFTYDSNQMNFQENVNVTASNYGPDMGIYDGPAIGTIEDYISYSEGFAPTTFMGGPLDLNIPQLVASKEYEGDWLVQGETLGTRFCLTNVYFRDWHGSAHAFPFALIDCTQEEANAFPGIGLILQDNSSDGQFYHLDTSNRSDYVVYAPDGTVYHFANPNLLCGSSFGGNCSASSDGSFENYLHMQMTSSVDRYGNTMTFSNGVLTDTVGRHIAITQRTYEVPTEIIQIAYDDSNGNSETVTLRSQPVTSQEMAYPTTIPQSTGTDEGPYFGGNGKNSNCITLNSESPPGPQYSVYLPNEPSGWTLPAETPSRNYPSLYVNYSSTGQSYQLLFDSFDHLLEIKYPEGGYHRYDYAMDGPFMTTGTLQCNMFVAEVAHRYECTSTSGASGTCSTPEAVTTYTGNVEGDDSFNQEMIVQHPDNSVDEHWFGNGALLAGDYSTGIETEVDQYSSNGNTLLRKTQSYFPNSGVGGVVPFPSQVTTTVEDVQPAISSTTYYSYDSVPSSMDPIGNSSNPFVYTNSRLIGNPVSTTTYDYTGTLINSKTQNWFYLASPHLVSEPNATTTIDYIQNKQKTVTLNHNSANGFVTGETLSGTNVSPLSYVYTLDAWGRPTAIQDPNNNVTKYNYSDSWANSGCAPSGNSYSYLTSVTNAKSQTTSYKYDSCTGQLASSLDPNNVTVSLQYDETSRITQREVTSSAGTANLLTVTYQDGPGGTITRTESASPDPSIVTQYSLDGIGRVFNQSVQSDPDGVTHVTTTFNPMGQVQAITNAYRSTSDPTYGTTSYSYDALGRKTTQINPDDSAQYWCYDGVASAGQPNCHSNLTGGVGEWVDYADESGNDWQQATSALGWLTNVAELGSPSQPFKLLTGYSYDGFGNLIAVNQNGQSGDTARTQRQFTYDGLSRLITSFNPETGTICYGQWSGSSCVNGYDGDGNLLHKTDARGITTSYGYDALNRVTTKTYSDGITLSSCFQYDSASATNGIGRLAAEWTQAGTCPATAPTSGFQTLRQFAGYNAMGQVTNETQCTPNASGPGSCSASTPFALSYSYDLAGNLSSYINGVNNVPVVQNGSIAFTLQYDGASRLSSLTSNWNNSLHPPNLFTADPTNGFTAAGALQNMLLGNNIVVNKTYDNRLRTTGETATRP